MANLDLTLPLVFPAGQIVALNVSEEEYLAKYAETYHEWVEGVVIRVSPSSAKHTLILKYLVKLLDTYLEMNPIGQMMIQPFVMRIGKTFREPDVLIVLHEHQERLTETGVKGAADICIEIVSEESISRDYGDKYKEYEAAGVQEYWILDPLHDETRFYRLQEDGRYATIMPDADGRYRTSLLPKLAFPIDTLWQDPLPTVVQVVELVKAMLNA